MDQGVRLCFSSPLLPEYKRLKSGIFKFSGLGAEDMTEGMNFHYHLNLTKVLFTTDSLKCIKALANNETDFAPIYAPQHRELKNYQVPVPIIPRKLFIVSGYNVSDFKIREKTRNLRTTVMTNFAIFDSFSYLITCLLLLVLLCLLIVNYCMRVKLKRRNKLTFRLVLFLIWRKYKKMNSKMRSVPFMVAVLSFVLMTHFTVLYKSEQVVGYKPEVIDSYEKLLQMPDSLPVFFDGLFPDSKEFKLAPVGSARWKVWQKLQAKVKNESEKFIVKGVDQSGYDKVMPLFTALIELQVVIISSYETAFMVSGTICSSSDENYLWKTVLTADSSENEELAGWCIRDSFQGSQPIISYMRHLAESGALLHYFKSIKSDIGYLLRGSSSKHKAEQSHLCRGYEKGYSETNGDVYSLRIGYYLSFVKMTLFLYSLSGAILALESLPRLMG